ncbi:predicted protein [Streptomyces albidoflavus]|nr:predicted protein [Streptomyces albidoflavus]
MGWALAASEAGGGGVDGASSLSGGASRFVAGRGVNWERGGSLDRECAGRWGVGVGGGRGARSVRRDGGRGAGRVRAGGARRTGRARCGACGAAYGARGVTLRGCAIGLGRWSTC